MIGRQLLHSTFNIPHFHRAITGLYGAIAKKSIAYTSRKAECQGSLSRWPRKSDTWDTGLIDDQREKPDGQRWRHVNPKNAKHGDAECHAASPPQRRLLMFMCHGKQSRCRRQKGRRPEGRTAFRPTGHVAGWANIS